MLLSLLLVSLRQTGKKTKEKVNRYLNKKKKTYGANFTFFIITLRRPINPVGLVEFALCSFRPLRTVSLQNLLTAGSLFLSVA
jgi:hypothetical protein